MIYKMHLPKKKSLKKFQPIFDYYSRCGRIPSLAYWKLTEQEIGLQISFKENAPNAIQAAWLLETYGKKIGGQTTEPELLFKFYNGKQMHGISVDSWSNALIEGIMFLWEFMNYDIPEWAYGDACGAVRRKLFDKKIYCPNCYFLKRGEYRKIWNGS